MPKLNEPRRVPCDLPDYPDAFVVLPPEWLGVHFQRRDEAVRAARVYNSNQITLAAIALALADEWGGIPGLGGDDPSKWDLAATPAALLVWLERAVYDDFARVYAVPKAPLPSSPAGMAMTAAEHTAGS